MGGGVNLVKGEMHLPQFRAKNFTFSLGSQNHFRARGGLPPQGGPGQKIIFGQFFFLFLLPKASQYYSPGFPTHHPGSPRTDRVLHAPHHLKCFK